MIINFEPILVNLLRKKNIATISFNHHPFRKKVFEFIRLVKSEKNLILEDNESYGLISAVLAVKKLKGDMAEVGVYKGGSAKLIAHYKGKHKLYLFDTFEGLPQSEMDFKKGQYKSSFGSVRDYLRRYQDIYIYKGLFPQSGQVIAKNRFSFVHLDLDLYKSTYNSLEFFYPRMVKGGIILSHDYLYSNTKIKKVFDKFFKNKPELVMGLPGYQCIITKR